MYWSWPVFMILYYPCFTLYNLTVLRSTMTSATRWTRSVGKQKSGSIYSVIWNYLQESLNVFSYFYTRWWTQTNSIFFFYKYCGFNLVLYIFYQRLWRKSTESRDHTSFVPLKDIMHSAFKLKPFLSNMTDKEVLLISIKGR